MDRVLIAAAVGLSAIGASGYVRLMCNRDMLRISCLLVLDYVKFRGVLNHEKCFGICTTITCVMSHESARVWFLATASNVVIFLNRTIARTRALDYRDFRAHAHPAGQRSDTDDD